MFFMTADHIPQLAAFWFRTENLRYPWQV